MANRCCELLRSASAGARPDRHRRHRHLPGAPIKKPHPVMRDAAFEKCQSSAGIASLAHYVKPVPMPSRTNTCCQRVLNLLFCSSRCRCISSRCCGSISGGSNGFRSSGSRFRSGNRCGCSNGSGSRCRRFFGFATSSEGSGSNDSGQYERFVHFKYYLVS